MLAVWSVSGLLFELPSGALADRFDRRLLLVLSPLIKAICFALWAMAEGQPWMFALGFIFWSFGQSLYSGTKEAVLYEQAHGARFGRGYDKLVGREWAFYEAGGMIGASAGGLMTLISPEFTMWMSVVPLIAASVVATALKDVRAHHRSNDEEAPADDQRDSYMQNFRNAVTEITTRPRLRFLIFYIGIGVILLAVFDEYEQLLYLAINIPLWAFGFVGAAFGLMTILVSSHAYRIKRLAVVGWLFPVAAGLSLLSFGAVSSLFALIPLAIAHAFMIPVDVLARAEFQKSMGGKSRATTTSALNLFIEAVALVLLLIVGLLIEIMGIARAYQIGGVYLLLFGAWSFLEYRRGVSVTSAS